MIDPQLFPYLSFPIRLEFGLKKDNTICFFQCEEHLQSYVNRYKLDRREIKIDYRDGEPVKSGQKHTKGLQSGTTKNSGGSTSRSKGSTKNVDTNRTSNRTRKSTK
jgi:hypothetical protein